MVTWRSFYADSELAKNSKQVIKSIGVVFGDIGISPIYTLMVIFETLPITPANVFGVVSLIIWTLTLLVTLQYAWLAMSLGKKGEGGTIVLRELLVPLLKSKHHIKFVTFLSFVGIALFFGDGVITPAMSILSAVGGIPLIPGLAGIGPKVLILIACIFTVFLFVSQQTGTEKISIAFGPLMVVWFVALAVSGFFGILHHPEILHAFDPLYALQFIVHHGFASFFVLSNVVLCATGGEALYADMGHLGRKPIIRAWYVVFIALALSYLGQGAYLLDHPQAHQILYEMFFSQAQPLYIPLLILSLCATVIASQSIISGIFSVVYQGITTNIIPMFKVDYTSSRLRSQVYIGFINWTLLIAVLGMIVFFKQASNLANAYGFAVTGTMALTGVMMTWIFFLRRSLFKAASAFFLTLTSITFFLSNMCKIPEGGYWSIIIAMIPLSVMLIYTRGQKRLVRSLQPTPLEDFLHRYTTTAAATGKIRGTALFFIRDIKAIPPYVVQIMFKSNIIYEDNIIVSVITRDDPFGVIGFFKGSLAPGFRIFEIHMGYMEMLDIEKILQNAGIQPKVIFYGMEEIVTKNIIWKIFSFIKHLAPSFVQFYKLPAHKLHGIVTLIEI
ncbi:MAG: KUP/HAK/KT family potassium transporter [Candidatus Babeliales bacterium]